MPSIFSKIIAGEIPCYKIAEDEFHVAFLDIFPLKRGHTLCVPKKEIDHIFDLSVDEYAALMKFSHRVASAIKQAIPCERIGQVVAGFEVPHAHVHLIPVNNMQEMNFSNPKLQLEKEEFSLIVNQIQKFI